MSRQDDLGLSLDILDADRLRQWAQNLLVYGPDITHWGSLPFVVSKLQTLATDIEKAVRDIGMLRSITENIVRTQPLQSIENTHGGHKSGHSE